MVKFPQPPSPAPLCWLLALTNQVLSALGKPMLPIESQTVEQLVSAGITTVAALISWWNNNSFTSAAIQADAEYARLKQAQMIRSRRFKNVSRRFR